MRLLCWLALVAWVPSLALSETVIARSGEHTGFTRVVLQVPAGTKWSLDSLDSKASLVLDVPDIVLDTSQLYSRISRARLISLRQSDPGGSLEFELGCACDVDAFLDSGSLLVIDIRDPVAVPPTRPPVRPVFATSPYRFYPTYKATVELPVITPPIGALPISRPAVAREDSRPNARISSTAVNISEQRLLAQINRAAGQGLLVLDAPPEPHLPHDPQVELPAVAPRTDAPEAVLRNMVATTVVDRDMQVIIDASAPAENGRSCIGSEYVALHNWGDERPFNSQISTLRAELVGEFDVVNAQAAAALARTYMHFGFGAEAKRVLDLADLPSVEHRILFDLADLLDGQGDIETISPFAHQQGCDGDVAMWSLLSEESVDVAVDFEAVHRAFARLPSHLRLHVGPRISRIIAGKGDLEAADVILRAVHRAAKETDSAYDLAAASVAMLRGDNELAAEQFIEVVSHGSEQSPQAVIDLVDTQWQNRMGISPDLPDLTAAYALEYRKSNLGPDLRRSQAVALALTGRFSDSFEILLDINNLDGSETQQSARIPVLTLLTENADDVTFLSFGLDDIKNDQSSLPIPLADAMARRMLDLGFAEAALQLLDVSNVTNTSENRHLMRAEAALAQNLPRNAMIELLSMSGEEASRLRAQAMWQLGDYQLAATHLIAANEFDEAARGLWLADQADAIPLNTGTRYDQIAATSLQFTQDRVPRGSQTPLAEAQALIAQSEAVRDGISELMAFVAAPSSAE